MTPVERLDRRLAHVDPATLPAPFIELLQHELAASRAATEPTLGDVYARARRILRALDGLRVIGLRPAPREHRAGPTTSTADTPEGDSDPPPTAPRTPRHTVVRVGRPGDPRWPTPPAQRELPLEDGGAE